MLFKYSFIIKLMKVNMLAVTTYALCLVFLELCILNMGVRFF